MREQRMERVCPDTWQRNGLPLRIHPRKDPSKECQVLPTYNEEGSFRGAHGDVISIRGKATLDRVPSAAVVATVIEKRRVDLVAGLAVKRQKEIRWKDVEFINALQLNDRCCVWVVRRYCAILEDATGLEQRIAEKEVFGIGAAPEDQTVALGVADVATITKHPTVGRNLVVVSFSHRITLCKTRIKMVITSLEV